MRDRREAERLADIAWLALRDASVSTLLTHTRSSWKSMHSCLLPKGCEGMLKLKRSQSTARIAEPCAFCACRLPVGDPELRCPRLPGG